MELLQDYLNRDKTLETIRLWVTHNIWQAAADQDNLVDHVAIELSQLLDGLTDEEYFRSQMRELVGRPVRAIWYLESTFPLLGMGEASVTGEIIHYLKLRHLPEAIEEGVTARARAESTDQLLAAEPA